MPNKYRETESMPEDGEGSQKNTEGHPDTCARGSASLPPDGFGNDMAVSMTLERIVDLTGEFVHLNELVVLHLDKRGGFTNPGEYHEIVRPVLDRLEVAIQTRYRPGMNTQDVKLIVCDWIDNEIAHLRK
jgi:hypothetical protein